MKNNDSNAVCIFALTTFIMEKFIDINFLHSYVTVNFSIAKFIHVLPNYMRHLTFSPLYLIMKTKGAQTVDILMVH